MGEMSGFLDLELRPMNISFKWATSGKQIWRCGMNQTSC